MPRWKVTLEVRLASSGTHTAELEEEAEDLNALMDSDRGEDLFDHLGEPDPDDIQKMSIIVERLP